VIDAPVIGGAGKAACGPGAYGNREGDKAEDWTTYDQHGNVVRLSDFCGKWVYIEFGSMGCGACVDHAPKLEAMYQRLRNTGEGLVVIDSLGENLNPLPPNALQGTPTAAELAEWATQNGQTLPVIADADYAIMARYYPFGPGTPYPVASERPMPEGLLIRPDGVIEYLGQMQAGGLESCINGEGCP
jgi:peroxiredoxin